MEALTAQQDIGFKIDAARLIAQVLWERGDAEEARQHIQLCLAVRAEKGWRPTDDLTNLASKFGINGAAMDSAALLQSLRSLWTRWTEDVSPNMSGVVTRILPSGHGGFIRGDNRTDFYFDTRDLKDRKSKLASGARVMFRTKPGYDRKRQRSTTVACDIRIAS